MPKMVVNADAYLMAAPNAAPNGAPVARPLTRGEVVDLSAEEAARGQAITVRNTYSSGGVTVSREEPALIPAAKEGEHRDAAAEAVKAARRDALLAELATVDPDAASAAQAAQPTAKPAAKTVG